MGDVFSGVMPFKLFLNTFHPARSNAPLPKLQFRVPLPCEDGIRDERRTRYYQHLDTVTDVCYAINTSAVCPSIKWFNTEHVCINIDGRLAVDDPKNMFKIDACGMDKKTAAQKLKTSKIPIMLEPDWSAMRVVMEFRIEEEDPVFAQDPERLDADRKEKASIPVLQQFRHQSRTNVTSIMILGRWARLLRYDHAGVVVTERFDWRANDGELLAEFLSRVEHAMPQEEGIDDSVEDISVLGGMESTIVTEARKAMQEFSDGMIDVPIVDDAPLRTVNCWDDSQLDDKGIPKLRTLVATFPLGLNYSIVGRYTVGFIGYDVDRRRAYWVKDSWPIDDPEFTREGRIYERLKDAGVPHLAEVECAGEVRWKADNSVQKSRTHEFVGQPWSRLTANVHPLSHYRILFKDIGRPVSKFETTKQLVTALSHAMEAHSAAYKDANVLHRDISPGNILINREGKGMLIDWDLALLHANLEKDLTGRKPRMLWRTGTWAFLSCALLTKPFEKMHELSDDLESFFWVLLYVVLRYRHGPKQWQERGCDSEFQAYLLQLFEWRNVKPDGICVGGKEKLNFLLGTPDHLSGADIAGMKDSSNKTIPTPLRSLILTLRGNFNDIYQRIQASEDADAIAALDAESDEDSNDHESDVLPGPPRPPKDLLAHPYPLECSFTTLFDTSEYIAARFDEAIAAKWPSRLDSSVDRFPFLHLPPQTRQSMAKKSISAQSTRSDNPEKRRTLDPSNNLHMKLSREEAAEDAKMRVGGDYITFDIPDPSARGGKRTRGEAGALESITEERESKIRKQSDQTVTLKRQAAGAPKEVFVRDDDGNLVKGAEGRVMLNQAWSAPS